MLNTYISKVNIRVLILCLSILTAGISAGIFFGGLLPHADKSYLIEFLVNTDSSPSFIRIANNLALILLIGLAGFTLYGFPLAMFILLFRGFSVGLCDCLILYNSGPEDFFTFTISFLLPQLFLCSVYLAVTTISVHYALSHLKQ